MNHQITQILFNIAVMAIPIIFAVTLHEVAHGWVANRCGDNTASSLGRLTLNPIKHIDPIGTVVVPIALLMFGGFIFGWAKPVPVDTRNLRNRKRDMALVAIAGPLANLGMALFWAFVLKILFNFFRYSITSGNIVVNFFLAMAEVGIMINLVLMVLNLLPIPPLDGSRVVASFLSPKMERKYSTIEPYGFIILVLLMAMSMLSHIIGPPVIFLRNLLLGI